jgi:hypothetical protein
MKRTCSKVLTVISPGGRFLAQITRLSQSSASFSSMVVAEFDVERFEPNGQNADDNDRGDRSCMTGRDVLDDLARRHPCGVCGTR